MQQLNRISHLSAFQQIQSFPLSDWLFMRSNAWIRRITTKEEKYLVWSNAFHVKRLPKAKNCLEIGDRGVSLLYYRSLIISVLFLIQE